MVRKALGSKEERKPVEKKETENREVQKRAGEETKAERPKKKNIISVVRPQNATSKEARDFAKNQGQKPARDSRPARPKSDRPQGDRPARAQGDRPAVSAQSAQSRPAGSNAGRTQNKEGRPQGDRPARPQNRDGRPAGNNTGRPQGDRPARPSGERNGERGSFSRGNGNGNGRPARPDRDRDRSTRMRTTAPAARLLMEEEAREGRMDGNPQVLIPSILASRSRDVTPAEKKKIRPRTTAGTISSAMTAVPATVRTRDTVSSPESRRHCRSRSISRNRRLRRK